MKKGLVILLILSVNVISGQSLSELEERRKETLKDIEYVDRLLKETSSERASSLQGLNIVSSKLRLRESIIAGIKDQIELLTTRIDLNEVAIELMEVDLEKLIDDYEKTILQAQRTSKGQP